MPSTLIGRGEPLRPLLSYPFYGAARKPLEEWRKRPSGSEKCCLGNVLDSYDVDDAKNSEESQQNRGSTSLWKKQFPGNRKHATEARLPSRVKKLGGVGTPVLLFALYNGTAQLRRARIRAQSPPRCSRFGKKFSIYNPFGEAKKTIEDLFFLEATVATDLSLVPTRNFIRVPSTGNERREQLVRVRPECENCRKLASGKHFWKP
ncbi:hypothetical protein HZH68_012255 [Vespula germanica]|uniref:Uncharacterized protein n=1 Tax=Vespula germanica TaxID=30212 RepID=A0A834JH86_VESGE|nr:hypothetical protein HZH68_012255 [Vespula germanica]